MTQAGTAELPLLVDTVNASDAVVPAPSRRETSRGRVLGACLLLLLVYVLLSFADDPHATIVSDSGGKLATLSSMEHRGTLDPDVGYWAERFDPSGALHPLLWTRHVGDRWMQATTLPMLEVAAPLYDVGGARLALLLPMLGAVFTALAARAVARRFGGGSEWAPFWAVGLATPVAIYALDFWEHSIGVALMVWGTIFLLDVVQRRAGWRGALAAGLLFGVAATLRTEALVYLVVSGGFACCVLVARERALRRAVRTGLLVLLGAAIPLFATGLMTRIVFGDDLRAGRAVGTAAGAGSDVSVRVREALNSAVGIGFGDLSISRDWLLGAMVVLLVGAGALALRSAQQRLQMIGVAADVLAALIVLLRFGPGLGYVPGLLVASPLAAAGLFVCWRDRNAWMLGTVALVALPVVWASSYTGSMSAQWGGRYVLVSGVLLAVGGCVVLRKTPRAFLATCLVAGLVTAGGVAWLSERTHTVADGMEQILERHDEVLISRRDQFFREVGAFYDPSRHWLTAVTDHQLSKAVRVARESGARELGIISVPGEPNARRLGDYVKGDSELVPYLRRDLRLQVTTYRLES